MTKLPKLLTEKIIHYATRNITFILLCKMTLNAPSHNYPLTV